MSSERYEFTDPFEGVEVKNVSIEDMRIDNRSSGAIFDGSNTENDLERDEDALKEIEEAFPGIDSGIIVSVWSQVHLDAKKVSYELNVMRETKDRLSSLVGQEDSK